MNNFKFYLFCIFFIPILFLSCGIFEPEDDWKPEKTYEIYGKLGAMEPVYHINHPPDNFQINLHENVAWSIDFTITFKDTSTWQIELVDYEGQANKGNTFSMEVGSTVIICMGDDCSGAFNVKSSKKSPIFGVRPERSYEYRTIQEGDYQNVVKMRVKRQDIPYDEASVKL